MSSTSTAAMLIRLVLSLGVVLALMVGAARLLQRSGGLRPARGGAASVQVLARQGLGRRASVAVLSVGGRALVVGVGEDGVRLLSDLGIDELGTPAQDLPAQVAPDPLVRRPVGVLGSPVLDRPAGRAKPLDVLRDWTVRRTGG